MELYEEILLHTFSTFQFDAEKVIEMQCYQVLERIKAIIKDDSLEDPECFDRIEEIVCALEDIGINCGGRHDFG